MLDDGREVDILDVVLPVDDSRVETECLPIRAAERREQLEGVIDPETCLGLRVGP